MTLLKAVTEIILGKDHLYLRVIVDHCKFWRFLIIFILQADPKGGGGRGGTPDLKWQQQSKDFSGFEIFNFRMLLGRNILALIFWGSLI